MELSQPTYTVNTVGKIVVDKAPEGTMSPNLADAVMICFQPASRALDIWTRLAG
jgi:phage terminase large subunit